MKKLILLTAFCLVGFTGLVQASSLYQVNDAAIEATLQASSSVSFSIAEATALLSPTSATAVLAEKNPLVAIVLAFFLGGLAIHRVYLGGRGILILVYLITCGGIFGIVPLIDIIVLAINYDDISQYVGNSKFFMW